MLAIAYFSKQIGITNQDTVGGTLMTFSQEKKKEKNLDKGWSTRTMKNQEKATQIIYFALLRTKN